MRTARILQWKRTYEHADTSCTHTALQACLCPESVPAGAHYHARTHTHTLCAMLSLCSLTHTHTHTHTHTQTHTHTHTHTHAHCPAPAPDLLCGRGRLHRPVPPRPGGRAAAGRGSGRGRQRGLVPQAGGGRGAHGSQRRVRELACLGGGAGCRYQPKLNQTQCNRARRGGVTGGNGLCVGAFRGMRGLGSGCRGVC